MSTRTTNFNIVKPEGTDLFAPLVYNNDAFDLIDGQMKINQDRGITPATITFQSGVFTVVRSVSSCPFLVFTAPADFSSGNTITVDGQIKTPRFMDGTAPATGAWKINYSVLCYVDGQILNIISSSAGADYSQIIGDLADLDTTDKSTIVNAMNEVVGNVSNLSGTVANHTTSITSLSNNKQNKADNALTTSNKTIIGAINELNAIINETVSNSSLGLDVVFEKQGHVVSVHCRNNTNADLIAQPNGYTLGQVSAPFRPSRVEYILANSHDYWLVVEANGRVSFVSTTFTNANTVVVATGSYIRS